MNSRQKGARGERELAKVLNEAGFKGSRRGQQFSGGSDSPDVVTKDPRLARFHFEGKRVEQGNLYKWLAQATADAAGGTKIPVVAHRKNGKEWVAILRLEDFLELIKRNDVLEQELIAAEDELQHEQERPDLDFDHNDPYGSF